MNLPRVAVTNVLLISFTLFVSSAFAGEAKKPPWKPLMDGKTLNGWHKVGDGEWTVEEGAFVGRADNARLYGLLVSDHVFKDFTVRLKFKCLSGDSGFYIRTIIKKPEKAHGLQVQVGRTNSGVGGIYESYGRAWLDKPSVEDEKKFLKDAVEGFRIAVVQRVPQEHAARQMGRLRAAGGGEKDDKADQNQYSD